MIEGGGGDVGGGAASAVGVGDRSIGARRRITMTVFARVGVVFGHVVRVLVYFVGYILFMCPMIAMEDMGQGDCRRGARARGVVRTTTNDVTDECVFDLVRANA